MRSFFALLIVGVLGLPIRASADDASVVILRTGTEPTCLDVDELAKAVTRHATLPVRAVRQATNAQEIIVSARDDRGKLMVTIRGGELDVVQAFDMPSCDTITDVVAAFVASTVKAPPQLIASPPSVGELAAAALQQLEQAGFQVRTRGINVAVAQDGNSNWMVVITGPGVCIRRRTLGELPAERDAAVARIVAVAANVIVDASSCSEPRTEAPSGRADLLEDALKPFATQAPFYEVGGVFMAVGGGAAGIAILSATDGELTRPHWIGLGASALWLGGGIASFSTRGEDYSGTIATTSMLAGMGVGLIALAYGGSAHDVNGELIFPDQRHDGLFIGGLALIATAARVGIDRAMHRPISARRLEAAHARLASEKLRATASQQDLDRIESDFRRWTSPTSMWSLVAPMFVGAAINGVRALDEPNEAERDLHLLVGSALAVEALIAVATYPAEYDRYERRLRGAGLVDVKFSMLPGGAAVAGRF